MKKIEGARVSGGASVLLALVASLSCGSGSSSVDRGKAIDSLTPAEKIQVCDDLNGAQGGYGRTVTCSDGSTQHTDADQASCMAAWPTSGQPCASLSVGAVLDCAHGIGADLCAFATAAACQPERDCIGP